MANENLSTVSLLQQMADWTKEKISDFSKISEINYTSVIERKRIKNGQIRQNGQYNIYSFPVEGGKVVYVELNKLSSSDEDQEIAFVDAADDIISVHSLDSSITDGTRTHVYMLVPDNATKMLVSIYTTLPLPVVYSTNLYLSNLKQFFKNATPIETIDGYYVNLRGGLTEGTVEGRVTETYSVNAGDTCFIDVVSIGAASLVFAFYNDTPSTDTYIQDVSLTGNSARRKVQVVVPTGAVYMRICFDGSCLNYRSVYFAEGVDLSDYPVIAGLLSNVTGLLTDVGSLKTTIGTLIGNAAIEYSEADLVPGFYYTKNLAVGGTISNVIASPSSDYMRCGKFSVKAGDNITICTSVDAKGGNSKARPYVLTDQNGVVRRAEDLSALGSICTNPPASVTAAYDGFLYVCEKMTVMGDYTFSVEIDRLTGDGIIPNMQKELDKINARISTSDETVSHTHADLTPGYYVSNNVEVGDTYKELIYGKDSDDFFCGRFNVRAGDIVTLCTTLGIGTSGSKSRVYFLTDKDKKVTVLTPIIGNRDALNVTITVDDDGYLYVGEKLSGMTGYTFSVEIKRTFDYSKLPAMQDDIDALKAEVIVDDSNPLSAVKQTPGMTAILHRIGVVGASFTNGGMDKTDGVFPQKAGREFSWPQRLARLCGITCFNFGQSGYWCKKWLDNDGGYYEAVGEPENKCDAYIISFASNDKESKSGYGLGTIDDVHVGNEDENGDSYYGYFSQVIARCHEVQERAYLFVLTYPAGFDITESGGYTQAMRDIVEAYKTAGYKIYLIDYAAYGMSTSDAIANNLKRGTHYVAAGYQYMTYEICTYIDWIIRHNIEDFKDAAFVRTTAEYVPTGGTPVGYDPEDYFVDNEYLDIDIRRPRDIILEEEFNDIFTDF